MSFASRLKEKRMRSGESLQALADAIGMSKAHVWDLETGKSTNPSADVVKKLSDHFKVSAGWWFDEEVGEGDPEQLKVMFRSLQDLDPQTLELIEALSRSARARRRTMQIDRMALADLGNCVQLAKAIYKQIGEPRPPILINDIAMAVGITAIQDLNVDDFEGALITDELKNEGVILIKKNSPLERQRFTVGHEVGHFINYWHQPPKGGFYCSKLDMLASGEGGSKQARMESEANEFAAEMLMPEPLFRRDFNKVPSPGLEHVVRWSGDYETSKLATTRRLVDLCDSPSALVQSKDGVVGYVHRNKDSFPFVELKRGMAIPRKSLTARFSSSEDGCSNTDETEPSHWISKDLRAGATMIEQVLVQRNGYRITLLTIDEAESEGEDDAYERERSEWNPQFR